MIMGSSKHKFQDTFEISYEQYFHNQYSYVVKLIRELQDKLGEEKTHEIVYPLFERMFVDWAKKSVEDSPINSLGDYIEYDQRAFTKTHTIEIKEATSTKYLAHVTECVFAKVFRGMGASKIGHDFICATDYACTSAYNPKLKLTRTKTLMQGAPYCDFCYTWKDGE